MSTNQIRKALQNHFGKRNYRITKSGEIHAKGTMPNTNKQGWFLFGFLGDATTAANIATL